MLATVHMSDAMLKEVADLDEQLAKRFAEMNIPDDWDNESSKSNTKTCTCPTCGKTHMQAGQTESSDE